MSDKQVVNKYHYIPAETLGVSLAEAMIGAKVPIEAKYFVTTKDVDYLVHALAVRQKRRDACTVVTARVCPVQNVADSLPLWNCKMADESLVRSYFSEITKVDLLKEVSVVIPDNPIAANKDTIEQFLFRLRKRPVPHPTHYLLSLMEHLVSNGFPDVLAGYSILAIPHEAYEVSTGTADKVNWFVSCEFAHNHGALDKIKAGRYLFTAKHKIAFLAEDIE